MFYDSFQLWHCYVLRFLLALTFLRFSEFWQALCAKFDSPNFSPEDSIQGQWVLYPPWWHTSPTVPNSFLYVLSIPIHIIYAYGRHRMSGLSKQALDSTQAKPFLHWPPESGPFVPYPGSGAKGHTGSGQVWIKEYFDVLVSIGWENTSIHL